MYRQGEPIGVSFGNSQDWKTLWYAGKVEERNRFYYLTDDEQFSRGETRVVAPWADVWASGGRPIWIDIDHMRLPGSKKGEFTIYERKTSLPWPLRTKPKEFTVDMQCALDLIFGSSNLDEVIRHNPKGPIVFLANNSAGPGGIAEYLQHKLHQRGDDRRVLGAEGKVVFYYDGPANKSALGVRPIVEGQDATPRFY